MKSLDDNTPTRVTVTGNLDRILVYRIGQIGDTIAALPSLWALREQFPRSRIAMLSEAPCKRTHLSPQAVLPIAGLIDRFEQYSGGASVKNFVASWRQISKIRKEGFETLVYLVPSRRSRRQRSRDHFFFRLCGIRRFFGEKGFEMNLLGKFPDGSVVTLPKEPDALLRRLELDGIRIPAPGFGCMDLLLTEDEHSRAEEWLKANGGSTVVADKWFAVCVGGKTSAQLWPVERYARVVQLLIERHKLFPVVIGGTGDCEIGERLVKSWNTGLNASGQLSVRESTALMKRAAFYLGNDTGVMHLAASLGIRCVAVFSARNPRGIWEPYGNGHTVLRFDVPCAGCRLSVCDQNLECLTNIGVGEVYEACIKMISDMKPG